MSSLSQKLKQNPNRRIAVLVAERGADWDAWVAPLRGADELAVVLQRDDESAGEFATRVRTRLRAIEAHAELAGAALVGGSDWDAPTLSARSLIMQALVAPMVAQNGGRVFLDAGTTQGRGRFAMQALATVVEEQIAGSGVDIVTAVETPKAPSRYPARRAA